MEYPVNLVLQIQNEEEHSIVDKALNDPDSLTADEISTFDKVMKTIQFRRQDSSTEARVRVGSTIISTGTNEDMEARFRTECAMHANSNVFVEEWISGVWTQRMARKLQKF
jgi:hypothetical protein